MSLKVGMFLLIKKLLQSMKFYSLENLLETGETTILSEMVKVSSWHKGCLLLLSEQKSAVT